MRVVPGESRVVIETNARGLLAAAAHDLRIEAPISSGESADETHGSARFVVAAMKVVATRRHGTSDWHPPSERDARDVEGRIREQAFEGLSEIVVDGVLDPNGDRAKIATRAARTQTIEASVSLERKGDTTKVHGSCTLSLAELGTGKIRVPLGAIKLDDRIHVTFDVVFAR